MESDSYTLGYAKLYKTIVDLLDQICSFLFLCFTLNIAFIFI